MMFLFLALIWVNGSPIGGHPFPVETGNEDGYRRFPETRKKPSAEVSGSGPRRLCGGSETRNRSRFSQKVRYFSRWVS